MRDSRSQFFLSFFFLLDTSQNSPISLWFSTSEVLGPLHNQFCHSLNPLRLSCPYPLLPLPSFEPPLPPPLLIFGENFSISLWFSLSEVLRALCNQFCYALKPLTSSYPYPQPPYPFLTPPLLLLHLVKIFFWNLSSINFDIFPNPLPLWYFYSLPPTKLTLLLSLSPPHSCHLIFDPNFFISILFLSLIYIPIWFGLKISDCKRMMQSLHQP